MRGAATLLISKFRRHFLRGYGQMSPNEVGQVMRTWRRASFCASNECVEVAQRGDEIILRDSAQPHGSMLHYTVKDWGSFMRRIKSGELDRLRS